MGCVVTTAFLRTIHGLTAGPIRLVKETNAMKNLRFKIHSWLKYAWNWIKHKAVVTCKDRSVIWKKFSSAYDVWAPRIYILLRIYNEMSTLISDVLQTLPQPM